MAYVLTDEVHYASIANKIREYNGTTNTYKPSEMAAAIDAICQGVSSGDNVVFVKSDPQWTNETSIQFTLPTDLQNIKAFVAILFDISSLAYSAIETALGSNSDSHPIVMFTVKTDSSTYVAQSITSSGGLGLTSSAISFQGTTSGSSVSWSIDPQLTNNYTSGYYLFCILE